MKKIIALTTCLFLYGASFAQKSTIAKSNPATAQRKLVASGKCAINGTFKDEHNHPISDVRLFVYGADSSILASGYTDAAGAYETNSVLKGKYDVKIVYPNSKTILVTGVMMKPGFTQISLKAEPPAADTSMPYIYFIPKPEDKKKTRRPGNTSTTTTTTTKVTTTTTTKAIPAANTTVPNKK